MTSSHRRSHFLYSQFTSLINRHFSEYGCKTVVLAFDDYDHVPSSKAMTQAKRAKQRVNYDFAQTNALPSRPPDDWGSAMANRTFKVKVVARVLDVTRTWFELKLKTDPRFAGLTLVLDYRGVPAVVHAAGAARGDSVQQFNIRSALCAPVKFRDRTFGAIYVDSSMVNYTFTAEQLALLNAIVAAYIYLLVPENLLRFVAWVLSNCIYRFRVQGSEHIPTQGAAVLVCNHVSFVDAVLLMAASPRPIRFLMDHRIFKVPVLGWLFKLAKAIPIAPRSEDPAAYEAALQAADRLAVVPAHPYASGQSA
jgi:hypothetical protein